MAPEAEQCPDADAVWVSRLPESRSHDRAVTLFPQRPRMTARGWNNWALRRSRLSADQVSEMECSGTQRATNSSGGGRRDPIPWRLQDWRQAMAVGKLTGSRQPPASYHDCNLTSGVLSVRPPLRGDIRYANHPRRRCRFFVQDSGKRRRSANEPF